MLAFDQDTWTTEQEIPTQLRRQHNADELDRDRLSRAAAPNPDEDDDLEDDDLALDDEGDDLALDDEDLDNDVVPGYDEDLDEDDDLDDDPLRASYDSNEDGVEDDGDQSFDLDGTNDPDELPEHDEVDKDEQIYPSEQEVRQPQEGSDTNFSEQTDVTPPRPHEFPSVGSPETSFESRPHGRTTGRMIGHEPGTEGI